jgi:hypothetical protein
MTPLRSTTTISAATEFRMTLLKASLSLRASSDCLRSVMSMMLPTTLTIRSPWRRASAVVRTHITEPLQLLKGTSIS